MQRPCVLELAGVFCCRIQVQKSTLDLAPACVRGRDVTGGRTSESGASAKRRAPLSLVLSQLSDPNRLHQSPMGLALTNFAHDLEQYVWMDDDLANDRTDRVPRIVGLFLARLK